jgi:outer membrane protein OmpA-like peptidoglycan-associated protein
MGFANEIQRGERMMHGKVPAILGTVIAMSLVGEGCATKKHVREAIAPVQNQVNDVQKQTADNRQAIGDLDRQVATADEKATDAGKRASAANDAALKANGAANQAQQSADHATSMAQQVNTRLDQTLANLDNYKLVTSQQVFFKTGRYILTKEEQSKLDDLTQNVASSKSFVIEVEGYADQTGDRSMNMELSRRRADAVVHYLTVEKNVPLRAIRVLGVGSEFPDADNKTRESRAENRRVDIKVYALDLTGSNATSQNTGSVAPEASR